MNRSQSVAVKRVWGTSDLASALLCPRAVTMRATVRTVTAAATTLARHHAHSFHPYVVLCGQHNDPHVMMRKWKHKGLPPRLQRKQMKLGPESKQC